MALPILPVLVPIPTQGALLDHHLSPPIEEEDEWAHPTFAFHNLDYIPSGYSGILAPYIETGPGTMRAAASLMGLDHLNSVRSALPSRQQIICDLGCGDGEFLIGLLGHINTPKIPISTINKQLPAHGLGIDYNASLIATATINALDAGHSCTWLTYDFNLDADDLVSQLMEIGVTHVFVYLVPKQLHLETVKSILTRLWEHGVVVCCHKFQPGYLVPARMDALMDIVVYERDESVKD